MDLIRELKDVRFQLDKRGYDCDAVDSFLAKVRADVADLQSQQETSQQRVTALEDQLASGESDNEGTLRRTLVLAQRLADETVADARKTANEMLVAASDEAEQTRQSADDEAEALMRTATADAATANQAARDAVEDAEAQARATIEASAAEALTSRAESIEEAERLLGEAETAGAARVEALEAAAQDEISRLRRPIRAEVDDLGAVRSALSADIDELEQHLADQRVRVRNAVDALRVGMSGSIEDLERVADDDELLSPVARPESSGASGADVERAPDIEIVDRVADVADASPTAQQLADEVDAALAAERAAGPGLLEVDSPALDETEPMEHEVDDAGPATERIPVVEDHVADAHVTAEEGGAVVSEQEPVDVFAAAGVDPDVDAEVVDLDSSPGALFGTELTDDLVEPRDVVLDDETDPAIADEASDLGFLTALSEAIDTQPIARES